MEHDDGECLTFPKNHNCLAEKENYLGPKPEHL